MVSKLLIFRRSLLYLFIIAILFIHAFASFFFAVGLWGNTRIFTNISHSMAPAIKLGDVILVKKYYMNSYKPGEIITFRSNMYGGNDVITHRIDKLGGNVYITKGDNNIYTDPQPVQPHLIIGKVIATIPSIGYWIIALNTILGKLMFLIVPMMIIIVTEVANIKAQRP